MDKPDARVYPLRCVDRHLREDGQASAYPMSDEEASLWGFIKFAPHDMPEIELQNNPLFVAEHELKSDDPFAGAALGSRAKKAKENADPLAAVEAFLIAVQSGVYPPVPVLRWLAQGLQTWHDNEGKVDIGKALRLTPGRGQTPPFKAALVEERNAMLTLDMDRLMYLGASREQAANLVAGRLSKEDWNKTKWEIKDLNVDALIALHKNNGKELVNLSEKHPLNDKQWVSSWLKNFRNEDMPKKIKSRL